MANERLYQFPSKASPVPADIIYAGDSASAFNEVNITIAALIGAYPNLLSIGGLTLGANTYVYVNNSSTYVAGTITALGVSLLAGSTVGAMQTTLGYTATPTASQFAGWDANSNLSSNNFNTGYATTVTAAGTTTLTVASPQQQYFTGSSNQTVAMPLTSTLVLGQSWLFVNLSSGTITINSSGGNAITTLGANSSTRVTCILTSGTSAASWSAATPVAGAGVVNSGTINNLAYYAATGSTVSALATANNGVLVTSAGGVPSISSTLPSSLVVPSPKITTGIFDTNGNEILALTPVASAVNYLGVTNAATLGAVGVSALGTDTNILLSIAGKGNAGAQLQGCSNASAASAGFVGEYMSATVASGAPVSLVSLTAKTITSISLTAGDWDVYGNVGFIVGGTCTVQEGGISLTTNVLSGDNIFVISNSGNCLSNNQSVPPLRVNVSTTTTVYLVALVNFSTSTVTAYGTIQARRAR